MDRDQARQALNDELVYFAQQRRLQLQDAAQSALQIGARTQYLRDHLGQSKAASAQLASVSPSHLTEWMAKAGEEGVEVDDPYWRIPFLTGSALTDFVLEHGGQARIIASYGHSDVFFLSGVDPEQLRSGFNLRDAHMMIQAQDEEWAAVANVNVGYEGTGSRNATRALQSLGLDPDLVAEIAYSNASDALFAGGPDPIELPVHSSARPVVPLAAPELVGDTWVVRMDEVDLVSGDDLAADRDAVLPAHLTAAGSHLDRWLKYLDSQPSEWCSGPRRARVYLDEEVAERDGFQQERSGMVVSSYQRPYTVIIEQGRAQLWIALPTSDEAGARFTRETYDVLRLAGFYVDDLEARDNRSAFWRWLNRLGETTPEYVDLDDAPLQATPRQGRSS